MSNKINFTISGTITTDRPLDETTIETALNAAAEGIEENMAATESVEFTEASGVGTISVSISTKKAEPEAPAADLLNP